MDPVTAVGLASSVVAFITFATSLVQGAIKIHDSLDGVLEENRSREAVVREMTRFAARLLPPDDSRLAGEERELCVLAAECRDLSGKLIELLGRIRPKDPGSRSQSLWASLKNKVHEKERADLEQRLDHCRSQLDLQLAFLNKSSLDALIESAKGDAAKLERLRNNVEDLHQGVQVAGISAEAQEQIRRLVDVQEGTLAAIIQSRILKSLAFEGMYGRADMVDEAHCTTFRWILDSHKDSHDANSHDDSDSDDDYDDSDSDDAHDDGDTDDDATLHGTEDDSSEEGDASSARNEAASDRDVLPKSEAPLPEADEDGSRAGSPNPDEESSPEKGEDDTSKHRAVLGPETGQDFVRREAREKFTSWLSSGEGVFHISGKLGSGKSTLMKYLSFHPGTKAELTKWAGKRATDVSADTS